MTDVHTPQSYSEQPEADQSRVNLHPDEQLQEHDRRMPSPLPDGENPDKLVIPDSPEDIEPKFDKVVLQGYTSTSEPVEGIEVEHAESEVFQNEMKKEGPSNGIKVPDIEVNSQPKPDSIEGNKTYEASSEEITLPSPIRTFRPPITPANSLGYALPKKKTSPFPLRQDVKPPQPRASTAGPRLTMRTPTPKISHPITGMRSNSARPRPSTTQASSTTPSQPSSSGKLLDPDAKAPSLPATPKINKKYENVKSRINATSDHKPTGGNVKIFHQPVKVNASSKIGSLQNANHVPGGGKVKIESHKIDFKDKAKPKIDAKSEAKQIKSEKKIVTQKLEWKAQSKIGSLENANHKPAGGDVKIFHQPIGLKNVQSKIGSLENANHVPGGGNVKVSEYRVTTPKSRSGASGSVNSIGSRTSFNDSRRSSSQIRPTNNNQ